VSLSQREYFGAVAEIRSLDDELGIPLLERTPRGVRLLPAGATLLPRARAMLADVAELAAGAGAARRAEGDPPDGGG
jgi:DNA-binding transcriptional LysR family regulator